MISALISKYHKLTARKVMASRLGVEGQSDDPDKEIEAVWRQILAYRPGDSSDEEALVRFLLDQTVNRAKDSRDSERASQKLLEMYEAHSHQWPDEATSHRVKFRRLLQTVGATTVAKRLEDRRVSGTGRNSNIQQQEPYISRYTTNW